MTSARSRRAERGMPSSGSQLAAPAAGTASGESTSSQQPSASVSSSAASRAVSSAVSAACTSMSVQGLASDVPFPSNSSLASSTPTAAPSSGGVQAQVQTTGVERSSESGVAALAAQATFIASQLREFEARAALAALHSMPSQPGAAASSPTASGGRGGKGEGGYASVLGAFSDKSGPAGKGSSKSAVPPSESAASTSAGPSSSVQPEALAPPASSSPAAITTAAFMPAGSSGSGGVKVSKLDDALEKSSGTHEVRKKNDRDKKRRKRGRIGNLFRELDRCLPPPANNKVRSVNETLRDAVQVVSARVSNVAAVAAPGASAPGGGAAAGVAAANQDGSNATGAAPAGHGVKDTHKDSGQVPPPPPPPPPPPLEEEKSVNGPSMQEVMLAAFDGVALITRDLTIVDANVAFTKLLHSPLDASALGSKDHLEPVCKAAKLTQSDVATVKHKAGASAAGAVRKRGITVASERELTGQNVGAKRKGSSVVESRLNRRAASDGEPAPPTSAPPEQLAEQQPPAPPQQQPPAPPPEKLGANSGGNSGKFAHLAAAVGMRVAGRATGRSLREFIRLDDLRRLESVLSHIAQESFADEGLRRGLLGLRFKSQEEKREGQQAEGESNGKGATAPSSPALPVEVVPCGGDLFGKAYFVFVLPAAQDNSPAAILSAISGLGAELEPADSQGFKALELADEVDKDGVHRLASHDVLRSPLAAAVCMALCGETAIAAFEQQLLAHDAELGKVMGQIRTCLPGKCQKNSSSLSSMILQASQQVSAKVRLRMVPGDQNLRIQVLLGTCVMWELELVERQGCVLVTSPNLPSFGAADPTMAVAAGKDAAGVGGHGGGNSGFGSNSKTGGWSQRPPAVGRVMLLRTGELWLSFEDSLAGLLAVRSGESHMSGPSAGQFRLLVLVE